MRIKGDIRAMALQELLNLTKEKREIVDSLKKWGLFGALEMLANIYSDRSHFVDELLQNADDAGASEVEFNLESGSLEITHNGKRLFNSEDVKSITTLGKSTKTTKSEDFSTVEDHRNKINKIGKFGVGFKSVFAITKSPRIHSDKYHFEITDLIVPREIDPINDGKRVTKIILPFNSLKVSSGDACKLISSCLEKLESESMLFLRNIEKIKWKTESNAGYYSKEPNEDGAVLIKQDKNKREQTGYFLVSDKVEIPEDDEESETAGETPTNKISLDIMIAYRLDDGNIKPIDDGTDNDKPRLFAFFPVKKEKTGLKFLVHAPYRMTPTRETIDFEINQNKLITEKLSQIISDSIKTLRDKKKLNIDVLSMLPIKCDGEHKHDLYRAAFDKVKSTFTTEPLLPRLKNNSYAIANESILAREKGLTKLLKITDCENLFGGRKYWLSTNITRDTAGGLRYYLMQELGIPEITMEKFCENITECFMRDKKDEWVMSFYSSVKENKALYRSSDNIHQKGVLRKLPIIRLENGSHINPENEEGKLQVYLPPTTGRSGFKTVKRKLVKNRESLEFLKNLGLKEPDGVAEIDELIIPKYREEPVDIPKKKYMADFKRVFDIWSDSSSEQKGKIIGLLEKSKFIRCKNLKGIISYQKPYMVYFPTDELKMWFDGNTRDNDAYFLDMPLALWERSKQFIEKLGVRYQLWMWGTGEINHPGKSYPQIEEVMRCINYVIPPYWRRYYCRSVNGFNPLFEIERLEHALENVTFERSKFLWNLLLIHPNKLRGYIEIKDFDPDPYYTSEELESRVMRCLKKYPGWLYDKDKQKITLPFDQITLDCLNDGYKKGDENIDNLVKALGLKPDKIRKFEEETGMKVVSPEKLEAFERWEKECEEEKRKQQSEAEDEASQEKGWTPKIKCEDAPLNIREMQVLLSPSGRDLSGQTNPDEENHGNPTDGDDSDEGENDSHSSHDRKKIGDWGEGYAKKYLEEKYPSQEVIWLNENGNVGKGYDFVIRKDGSDIAYYEIKAKTDKLPRLFKVTGTQWNWAKQLFDDGKGDMYRILLVLNAGSEEGAAEIVEPPIINPVKLWKEGKLYADPVNIKI